MTEDRAPFGISETRRYVSPGAEDLLYQTISAGTGEIELVDYMGGDGMVERVATAGRGRGIFPHEDISREDLIDSLSANGIYDPFRSTQLKLRVQGPIAVALSLVYEGSCSVNEYSLRYSEALESSYVPSLEAIASALEGDNIEERAQEIRSVFAHNRARSFANYRELLGMDLARELSRASLGTDNDTKFFWKIDLFSLDRFLHREYHRVGEEHVLSPYLEVLNTIASQAAPLAWNALDAREETISDYPLPDFPRDSEIVDPDLSPAQWEPQLTRRVTVPAIEERLFSIRHFLDHGQFQVVDYMGDDNAFAQAARVSYGAGTKTLTDNRNLVRSLIRDRHTSPIEMAELAFESRSPMFSDPRQAARHRTLDNHGFMGEHPLGSEYFIPEDPQIKYQDRVNRQGRGKEMDPEDLVLSKEILIANQEAQLQTAIRLQELGAPEELVRMTKGVGFYTPMWRTGDVNNLFKFLSLRDEPHAQAEVRALAQEIGSAVQAFVPHAHQAFLDYGQNAISFSSKEQDLLRGMLREGIDPETLETFEGAGFIVPSGAGRPRSLGREGQGFQKKLRRILE